MMNRKRNHELARQSDLAVLCSFGSLRSQNSHKKSHRPIALVALFYIVASGIFLFSTYQVEMEQRIPLLLSKIDGT